MNCVAGFPKKPRPSPGIPPARWTLRKRTLGRWRGSWNFLEAIISASTVDSLDLLRVVSNTRKRCATHAKQNLDFRKKLIITVAKTYDYVLEVWLHLQLKTAAETMVNDLREHLETSYLLHKLRVIDASDDDTQGYTFSIQVQTSFQEPQMNLEEPTDSRGGRIPSGTASLS